MFTLWLNSLEVNPGVVNLLEDLRDGVILLQAFEKTFGTGSVVWKRVGRAREGGEMGRFKMVENCNYVVELGGKAGLVLVGVSLAFLLLLLPLATEMKEGKREVEKLILLLSIRRFKEQISLTEIKLSLSVSFGN